MEIVQIYQRWPQTDSLVAGPWKAVGGQTCGGLWGSRSRIYITADWAAYVFLLIDIFGPGYCCNSKNSLFEEKNCRLMSSLVERKGWRRVTETRWRKHSLTKGFPANVFNFRLEKRPTAKLILLLSFSIALSQNTSPLSQWRIWIRLVLTRP